MELGGFLMRLKIRYGGEWDWVFIGIELMVGPGR